MTDSVGGPIYIGDAPGSETFPETDSTIDKNQIVKNAVVVPKAEPTPMTKSSELSSSPI